MNLDIVDLERFTINLPFREVAERNMFRALPDFTFIEILRVSLKCGIVGTGEAMHFYYPDGETNADTVKRVVGRNAYEVMWDDAIGYGLQIALFDAVGRALEVPIHALLGEKVRDRAKLSWWAIDMPPGDWASECQTAVELGYRDFKAKARPWYDIYAQMEAITRVVPEDFCLDLDFNGTLLDAEHAIPIVRKLEKQYPIFHICEGPVYPVEENKKLRAAVDVPIAHHQDAIGNQMLEDYCDGYVLGGGASSLLRDGVVCAAFDRPFWLQQVGSGITAVFSMHLAAVLPHATWPGISCNDLYLEEVLATPIEMVKGSAEIPDGPGLGVEIDLDTLESLRLHEPYEGYDPPRLIEVTWPDGAKFYYSNGIQLWRDAQAGNMPCYIEGVETRTLPDDGSAQWRDLREGALEAPVRLR